MNFSWTLTIPPFLKFVDQWAPRNVARDANFLFQEPKGLPENFLGSSLVQSPCYYGYVTHKYSQFFWAHW